MKTEHELIRSLNGEQRMLYDAFLRKIGLVVYLIVTMALFVGIFIGYLVAGCKL